MTLSERLKMARKRAKLTQIQLAETTGVPQQNISSIESGKQDKSADIVRLAIACGVRAEWLDQGIGPMIDGYTTSDELVRRVMVIMEPLPEYAKHHVLKEIAETIELVKRATAASEQRDSTHHRNGTEK